MSVAEQIRAEARTSFSFEVMPPVRGAGLKGLFSMIDSLCEFGPEHINITTRRKEITYVEMPNGSFERRNVQTRPGTVAVAAAIQTRYNVNVVPHILCSGFSAEEIEYTLLDLQYLGITELLLLRGDKGKDEVRFVPSEHGWRHALDLEKQVNDFNGGKFLDGSQTTPPANPFHYGVAGYPEKHEEALSMEKDLYWLKQKVDAGADYVCTQMFYDNSKFFSFVEQARALGITVPIIPGIRPLSKLSQLRTLPNTFKISLPEELLKEGAKCKDDNEARSLGIEWCVAQCRELIAHGVPCIHFYTISAVESVRQVAGQIY